PAARVWPGYITIATMFGIAPHWVDNPNKAPGVAEHVIHDMREVYTLKLPETGKDGFMPFNIKWLTFFSEKFPKDVSLTGLDLGGPLNTAKDLLDTNLLFTAFYDNPKDLHYLLNLVTEVQVNCYREILKAIGDINRLTCIDFDPIWAPEGRKGFISDDVCSSLSPKIFREFSMPYNNRVFKLWKGGRIHNCGPHPSIDLYLHHDPEINGLNCSYKYTKDELLKVKSAFKGKGIIELMFDNCETYAEIIKGFEEAAHILVPDVVAIPMVWLNENHTNNDIKEIFHGLKKVGEAYAREMHWVRETA
ncbi:MAG: uroporphyrinogen decarboxylase family protein, partial [Spirochaetota bacterium]